VHGAAKSKETKNPRPFHGSTVPAKANVAPNHMHVPGSITH
jgi:hypothetical protein